MRTVYLNGRFLTQNITGVQRVAYELVVALDNLIEEGHIDKNEFTFILIYSGDLLNQIQLKHIRLLKKGLLKGNLWEQLELPFYTFRHCLISMCTISALFKSRQLVIVHDASFQVNPSFFSLVFRAWYQLAIRFLAIVSKQIITVSDFSKAELVKYVGIKPQKITVVSNAADHMSRFDEPDFPFREKIDGLKPYCLAVSSLGKNKNFEGLSKAVRLADFQNYNMVVAGGKITTLQAAEPDQTISYIGYVTNEQLKYLYRNAALFIFPSFYEGFGIPPLEAMTMGCPVLSSDTSAMPQVLGDACIYCDPYSAEDIAAKITMLINDDQLAAELRAKGNIRATHYSWKHSAEQLFKLIAKYT